MSEPSEFELARICSFCHELLNDVIKVIPCGKSICGRCYKDLKEDVDQESREFECAVCRQKHILPLNGFPDNEQLLVVLRKLFRRAMPENARVLQNQIKVLDVEIEKLKSFDSKEFIKDYCEKLEIMASEAIGKAIKHLEDTEREIMKKIKQYREKCLEIQVIQSERHPSVEQLKLKTLISELDEFKKRWNNFFDDIEVFENEKDIGVALDKISEYIQRMHLFKEELKKKALNWETMTFKNNSHFTENWGHVGEIEIIAEPKMNIQAMPSFTLTDQSLEFCQLSFLPDGKLVSCSKDGKIIVWNVQDGTIFSEFTDKNSISSMAILRNGQLATGANDNTIKIWNLKEKKQIRMIKGHSKVVPSLQELRNGNLASYSCDDTIKIWNLCSNEEKPITTIKGHGNSYWELSLFGVLPNDSLVTCSCDTDHKLHRNECIVRIWNPNAPKTSSDQTVSTGLNDVQVLLVLSNEEVALGSEKGTIKIIRFTKDGSSKDPIKAHQEFVKSLAQLSNLNLVSAGKDDSKFTIKVWNLFDHSLLQTISTEHSGAINSLSISADEKLLASGSCDSTIKLWPINNRSILLNTLAAFSERVDEHGKELENSEV